MKRLLVVAVTAINFMLLFACSPTSMGGFPSATRTVPPEIPSYPLGYDEQSSIERKGTSRERYITLFKSRDSSTKVVEFYQDHLLAEGWKLSVQKADYLQMSDLKACPYYELFLSTERNSESDGVEDTAVKIELVTDPCVGG